MPGEGLFHDTGEDIISCAISVTCDAVRRGWVEYFTPGGVFGAGTWKRRWAVLSAGVLVRDRVVAT
jgi:hypothetical protein